MAAIKDRNSPRRSQKSFRISTLKSSGDPTPQSASRSYPNAGSSNGPLLGSIAAEGSPKIGRTSIARRLHSCASPQFASCSENSVIRPKVSGQTLIIGAGRLAIQKGIEAGLALFTWLSIRNGPDGAAVLSYPANVYRPENRPGEGASETIWVG